MRNNTNIILVGPLPPPIGGVSSHILGLSNILKANGFNCAVIDGYPDEIKGTLSGIDHKVFSGQWRLLAIIWYLWINKSVGNTIIHLHFSKIIGRFLVCALFLLKRRRKVFLTLHHGDQSASYKKAIWPLKLLSIFALRRMDKIVALSHQQQKFYQSISIPIECLERWHTSPSATVIPDPNFLPIEARYLVPIEAGGEETILMTSGYPMHYYGFEVCIELLDKISADRPCRLIVSLYGKTNDSKYEKKLRSKLLQHPKIVLVGPLPSTGFAALLSKASMYLRPSTVDSYGVAITEALNLGIPCLASDVCARDPRCETFPVGDKDAFFRQAEELIEQGRKSQNRQNFPGSTDTSNIHEILKCYQ